jgi:hypothetical protein
MAKFCAICNVNIEMRDSRAVFCFKCTDEKGKRTGGRKASFLVKKAIKDGILPELKNLICVDCKAPAKCYDHRDYNKPLEVVPVCKRCNKIRGSGIFVS